MILIGFGHLARTGKDTAARALVEQAGFERVAFADALRQLVYATHPQVRAVVDDLGWDDAKVAHDWVRVALQRMGEGVRRHVDPDAWVRALFRRLEPDGRYVIPDVRYPNEAEAILEHGGQVVRIDRPGVRPVNGHVSERALLGWTGWTSVITNDGTAEDLQAAALALCGELAP